MDDRRLPIAERWAERNPPGPHDRRDALLGWFGFAMVAGAFWRILG